MEALSVVGKSLPRVDALEKVMGRAKYVADLEIPRMLHAKVLRGKYAHARILSIDTSEVETVSGVKAVVTAKDMPQGIELGTSDPYSLAVDKVRYAGEEVAAVAAEDELIAEEALGLIKVEYEELPAITDPEEAMKPGAPKIHDVENNIMYEIATEFGDMAKGYEEADYIFEEKFATQHVHPCQLEPTTCIATFDGADKLKFWDNSLDPFKRCRLVAKALGMSPSKVRITQKFKGGNFGARQADLTPYIICALLAKKTGRPVRLVLTREEEFLNTRPRNIAVTYLKMGVKKDGMITARDFKIIINGGAYCDLGPEMLTGGFQVCAGLYRGENVRFEGKCIYTNTPPVGPHRSFGSVQPTFAIESMMDMVAEKIGMDPVEFRLKNATQIGDLTVVGQKISSCGLRECIEKVVEYSSWKEKRTQRQSDRGIGVACAMYHSEIRTGPFAGSVAYVRIMEDGRAKIMSGEYEWGQGSCTVLSQIAAEELGVPLEAVEFAEFDTDVLPYTLGPYGGGPVTVRGGQAIRLACMDAKRQLIAIAAKMLNVAPENVEMKEQRFWVKGNHKKSLSVAEVASYAKYNIATEIVGRGAFEPNTVIPDGETLYGDYSSNYTFAAQSAEVQVDPETGRVTVLSIAGAFDLGKAINPILAEGQNEGGIAQEIGITMREQVLFDEKGRVTNQMHPTAPMGRKQSAKQPVCRRLQPWRMRFIMLLA